MSMAVRVHAMDGASGDNTPTKDHYTYLPFFYKDMCIDQLLVILQLLMYSHDCS